MKILLYGINFFPELTGIGKYTGEMADWLSGQGHEVRVVTAPPYYPGWQVGASYSASRYVRERISPGSVPIDVWRCPLWVPARVSGLNRLVHLASFALSSLPVMLLQVFWKPDVVWVAAPALMCAPGAWLTARLSGAKAVVHIQDYEVDAAFQLGVLKNRLVRRLALLCERVLLRSFDVVSTISGRMVELAREKGVEARKLVFFPNWVDLSSFAVSRGDAGQVQDSGCNKEVSVCDEMDSNGFADASLPTQEVPDRASGKTPGSVASYRAELGIPDSAVVALYSGNMGMKQGLEVLPEAARLLAVSHPGLYFVFCGQGPGKAPLEVSCAGLINVRLLPLQPIERLGALLSMADIHLLPQRADAADLVMPSKLTGMLASARPVVATAQAGTELAGVVSTCGLVVEPDNAQALAQAVLRLAEDRALRVKLGSAGRVYAEQYLDREVVLRRYWGDGCLTEM